MIREGGELFVLFEVYEPGVIRPGHRYRGQWSLFNRKGKALESEPVVLDTRQMQNTVSGRSSAFPWPICRPATIYAR